MKLSQLIEKAQQALKEIGDVDVVIPEAVPGQVEAYFGFLPWYHKPRFLITSEKLDIKSYITKTHPDQQTLDIKA